MPDKTDLDAILRALGAEGFGLPFAARSRDYPDHDDLRDADARAHQDNRDALRRALAGRLLPEGGQTRTEWAVDGVAGYDVRGNPAPYDSEQGARAGVGYWRRHGVETRVVSRGVREYDDGSSFTGPWVAVDQPKED